MSYVNDAEAFCLANTYNLSPPRATNPRRLRNVNAGKYEPDHNESAETRCMTLAHWQDKTNVIIQYAPLELAYET
jgi:hypothetical protein